MKCMNCGNESSGYLCPDCLTEEILDKIFSDIRFYKPETCSNSHLAEYVTGLDDPQSLRECIPDLLALFPESVAAYYFCVYYFMQNDDRFEGAVKQYLADHDRIEPKSQILISYLLKKYIRHDFFKPREYCDWIAAAENGISSELYLRAAEYFAMIAEYDLADQLTEKGLACDIYLYTDRDKMREYLEKQKTDTEHYRTKKPYWPSTEDARRVVALFYDAKGISYPRIETKPVKVPENEFEPLSECYDLPDEYCAFWCAEGFSINTVKSIYQIAAVKVKNGKEADSFRSYIRMQDGIRERTAKSAGIPLSMIEDAEDVDQVMVKFFAFVGDAVLVSTGALGQQAKLISRAARYTGMKRIENSFLDLLDAAAETDSKFDMQNNSREYLLQYFGIAEGADALGKARANMFLCEGLKAYEK